MKASAILTAALLCGCTMSGEVDMEATPELMRCTDFRDGETFDIRREDIKNARFGLGGADTCVYAVDTNGKDRALCKSMDSYMKCEEAKQ